MQEEGETAACSPGVAYLRCRPMLLGNTGSAVRKRDAYINLKSSGVYRETIINGAFKL